MAAEIGQEELPAASERKFNSIKCDFKENTIIEKPRVEKQKGFIEDTNKVKKDEKQLEDFLINS